MIFWQTNRESFEKQGVNNMHRCAMSQCLGALVFSSNQMFTLLGRKIEVEAFRGRIFIALKK